MKFERWIKRWIKRWSSSTVCLAKSLSASWLWKQKIAICELSVSEVLYATCRSGTLAACDYLTVRFRPVCVHSLVSKFGQNSSYQLVEVSGRTDCSTLNGVWLAMVAIAAEVWKLRKSSTKPEKKKLNLGMALRMIVTNSLNRPN